MARPVKIKKWGNSLAIRIPYFVAHNVGLREGDTVRMLVDKNVITITATLTEEHMYELALESDDLT